MLQQLLNCCSSLLLLPLLPAEEDKCLGVTCAPSGPCQRSSTCNPKTGKCDPDYVSEGQACLGSSGLCTRDHICGELCDHQPQQSTAACCLHRSRL